MTAIHSTIPSLSALSLSEDFTPFFHECAYNDLREGRVSALLSMSLLYEQTSEQGLVPQMQRLFSKFIEDAFFYDDTLIWIAPPTEAITSPLFTKNIGIYLGLWLIRTYLNSESSILYVLDNISLDAQLREITSSVYRKRIRNLLKNEAMSLSEEDMHALLDYYEKCKRSVVLEALVCLCFKKGLFRVVSVFQRVKIFLMETDTVSAVFIEKMRIIFSSRDQLHSFSINLCHDVAATMIRNRFTAIYQFCGEQFVESVLLKSAAKNKFKPSQWLTKLHDSYPSRNILFNQLIRRERFLLKIPIHVFNNHAGNEPFNYNLDFLKLCYQSDMPTLCNYSFKLDMAKFKYRFDTFCIKLLISQDFSKLNHPLKFSYFRQFYRHVQFSLLLVKRYEKEIVWQGRSFTDNLEVDFLFFFINDFHSINEYKTHFAKKKLTDTEILEIFFWALEMGIVEPSSV